MSKRLLSYALSVLAVGILGFWGLRLLPGASDANQPVVVAASPASELPRTMNGEPSPLPSTLPAVAPAPPSRFQLFNVALPPANADKRTGTASIAVDGLPPKTYRIGDRVVGAVVLQSVEPASAALGPADGPAAIVLRMAPPVTAGATAKVSSGTDARREAAEAQPVIRAASSPPVNRQAVPVTDPDHGVDTSNR